MDLLTLILVISSITCGLVAVVIGMIVIFILNEIKK